MGAPIRVAVTGAAGQIGYSILFRIASGEVFGKDQKVRLSLIELPQAISAAEGTAMELEDCGYAALDGIDIHDNPNDGFKGVNWALMIGSKPRGPGMERNDLIKENGPIFTSQGKALAGAASDVRGVVVGNPCNTNALIAMHNCKEVEATRFSAMTMLDENRAKSQLAIKAGVPVEKIKNLIVWGNHSSTMYPDYEGASIDGRALTESITDTAWLQSDFLTTVQKRGAAIIAARGKSSAASAASSCIDHVMKFANKTPAGEYFSAAVPSDGSVYDIPAGLIFSFPIRSNGDGSYEIVKDLPLSDFARGKIKTSTDELLQEREVIKDLLG